MLSVFKGGLALLLAVSLLSVQAQDWNCPVQGSTPSSPANSHGGQLGHWLNRAQGALNQGVKIDPGKAIKQGAHAAENYGLEEVLKPVFGDLPLNIDAKSQTYPTVCRLPGGPFHPKPLPLTIGNLVEPPPPGDYWLPVLAFCTEYTIHRRAPGVRYKLEPVEGRAAGAISTLLWRGVMSGKYSEPHLQATSWGIQSGLLYNSMPDSLKRTIAELLPEDEYRKQLQGNFFQSLKDKYQGYAKTHPGTPPLDDVLRRMDKPGELALDAEKQEDILQQKNTRDEIKEQTLIDRQGPDDARGLTPEDTPWTVFIPDVAYMRFIVGGGNMARDNRLEIRILSQSQPRAMLPGGGYLLSVQNPALRSADLTPSIFQIMGVQLARLSPAAAAAAEACAAGPVAVAGCAAVVGAITVRALIAYPNAATQSLIVVLALPLTAEQLLLQSLVSYMKGGGNGDGEGISKPNPKNEEFRSMTARQIITTWLKGSIKSVFPGELLDDTFAEIDNLAQQGNPAAQTARKLLLDGRFRR
ncbi:MAG TPA: hypothetical protein VMF91_07475 [Bryobacteraceae bacterium]|nr:hypothetical protein [Bryobacteraceae bacterium]